MSAAARKAQPLPPIGARFERVEHRKGKVVSRRVYQLAASAPPEPGMAGDHTLVCILDEAWGETAKNDQGGTEMHVEDAWFTERTDFKRVAA